ncbi:hypothetical protein TNCT_359861 [Trichonephila clavata]|uniref:Uncharacterized protein n=1 Tax=Trichonephila clavata TaxID=2740835 RepID=A0A8X6HM63_TRICU|nr:hypothetical protein TNCT_359861 [Trichonephila clavata]
MTGMGQKTCQDDFVKRQFAISHSKTSERHLEIALMRHPSAPALLVRPGTISLSPLRINGACVLQWPHCAFSAFFSSTSSISKNLENGSTNGLPQNTSNFSCMVFINYLKNGRNL